MRSFAALAVLLWVTAADAYSQGRMNHWIFGRGYHVEFTQSGPVFRGMREGYYAFEGAASYSDLNGSLLYYSNSSSIWNRDTALLYNSEGVFTSPSASGTTVTNGTLFLPWPGDTADRYTAMLNISNAGRRVHMTKLDRELDNGYGGVVDDFKRVQLWDTAVAEHMVAVKHANGRDWWLIFRTQFGSGEGQHTHFIYALFTPDGVGKPQVTLSGPPTGPAGEMAVSPKGDFVAIADYQNKKILLYRYDRCYGAIHFIDSILSPLIQPYGLSFSARENALYVSTDQSQSVLYYNFNEYGFVDGDAVFLGSNNYGNRFGAVEMGPDKKIYGVMWRFPGMGFEGYDRHIFAIDDSGFGGHEIEFDTFAIYIGEIFNITGSLPNFPNYDLGPLVGSPCDTLSPPDTTQVGLPALPSAPAWSWSVTPTVSGSNFQVSTSQPAGLTVHDLYGRERLSMDCAGQCGFDLSQHPAGWYVVSLTDRSGRRSEARKVFWQP
jgi:hypothetical protein